MPRPGIPTAQAHARRERRPLDDAPAVQPMRLGRLNNCPAVATNFVFSGLLYG